MGSRHKSRGGSSSWKRGAAIVDVGGESGVTHRPPLSVAEEIGRVVPLVDRLAGWVSSFRSTPTSPPWRVPRSRWELR
jgi:dihydropteroate synthase